MYVTNELQTDLIGMQIEDSKVEVIYWFQGAIRKLRSTVFVSDGEWHSVCLFGHAFHIMNHVCISLSFMIVFVINEKNAVL